MDSALTPVENLTSRPRKSGKTRGGVPRTRTGAIVWGHMQTLKMQDAAALLNVSPSTLRSWERRFAYPVPMRSAGGHRHYAHGEIVALRDALEDGLSISSAIGRAREALIGATPDSLTRALMAMDFERADAAMEGSLALRTLERAVEDVLLAALQDVAARTGRDSAPFTLAAGWAGDWLRRARRLCPPAWGITSVLIGDATSELELDRLRVQVLELLCLRAGAEVTTLPVYALTGLHDVLRSVLPDVVVLAGSHAEDDAVARWSYLVQRSLGGRTQVRYLRDGSGRGGGALTILTDSPTVAQQQLLELVVARVPEATGRIGSA